MKVLVIEDNPANMRLASDLLKMDGHTVIEATEAETGISLAKTEKPALIFMDIQLPGIDGISALRILKQDEEMRHTRIIALTALAMSGDKDRLLAAGFDGYMSKPIRYKEFLETVAQFSKENNNALS